MQVAFSSSGSGFLLPGIGASFALDAAGLGFDRGIFVPAQSNGQDLDNFMQQVVAGITGLNPSLVRPRWQPEPPTMPVGDWCAVGVSRSDFIGYPASVYASNLPPGAGSAWQQDQEEFEVLCSFYGTGADRNVTLLREGLFIQNNRDFLSLLGMSVWQTSGRTRVPELVHQQWIDRTDITMRMRRMIVEVYPVLYFLSVPIEVVTDTGAFSNRTAA